VYLLPLTTKGKKDKNKKREKVVNHLKTNHSCSFHCLSLRMMLAALAVLALASIQLAQAREDNRAPNLPSPLCDRLQVQPGNKVAFHVYALGVQIYRWNGTSWDFVAPSARLFADAEYHGEVGIHYAGPHLGEPQWRQSGRQPSGKLRA
jgi:hypothetical protein